MAEQEKQRFSWKGMLVILVLAGITYVLVREEKLLYLYSLATVLLVGFLAVVAFDVGLGQGGGAPAQEDTAEAVAPIASPVPKAGKKKRR
jgi:hypothetical protein